MILNSDHHFYAAHRNQLVNDQCQFLHGHTYFVSIDFNFNKTNEAGVSMLFSDLDKLVDTKIKEYDHATLIDYQDNELIECATRFPQIFGKIKRINGPSSLENLAKQIYTDMIQLKLPVSCVTIKETTSKKIIYKYE